jgi:hypothetical protein
MKRYILIAAIGGCALIAGHLAVSLGLCPQQMAPLSRLAQGCVALVVGSALFASGMLGLAEGYERAAGQVRDLLGVRQAPDEPLEVAALPDLEERNRAFWRGYLRSAAGIALFLAGLLGLSASLARATPTLYLSAVGIGVVSLGLVTLYLAYGGLRRMRRTHVAVAGTAQVLESQPEKVTERPVVTKRRVPAYTLFRHSGRYPRSVDQRRGERQRTYSPSQ